MSIDERMTVDERRKYLCKMQKRYQRATRQEKKRLLDEMQPVTELHRKSLTRLLGQSLARQPRQRQRGRTYGREVVYAIAVIAESLDHVCAERLQPQLVWLARHLAQHGELTTTPHLLDQLETVSVSTVRRILQRQPRERPRLPRSATERANRVTRAIPTRRIPWQEQQPGHLEVDLVHHCGTTAAGDYVHTLQLIDVATGWSERVAVLGRSYRVMQDAFRRIQARLPFSVQEIHPDNGSEFLNDHLLRFWQDTFTGAQLSRSRPWQKNDNRFVEQKNDTLVRAYLGHDRLDTVAQTNWLNQLYDQMWLYYNFFPPVLRLTEKTVQFTDPGQPTIVRRHYARAQTPLERLRATQMLTAEREAQLLALRDATNPRQLRQHIYALLDQLWELPTATPGNTQNVFLTLFEPLAYLKGADISVTLSNDGTIRLR